MKKSLIIIIVGLLLVVAGFLSFKWWKYSNIGIWSFVPSNSVMVFQPTNFSSLWNSEEDRKILKNIKTIQALDSAQITIEIFDSLTNRKISEVLDKNNLLISFHQTTNESIGALYILEIKKLDQHSFFSEIVSYLTDSLNYQKSERNYQGYVITEFKNGESELAYIFHKNFLIASFNSFLVDDAIRMIVDEKSNPYLEKESIIEEINQGLQGSGRCFINTTLLNKFIGIFAHPVNLDTSPLQRFTNMMYLDLTIENDKIDFSGFAVNDTTQISYLSAFKGIRGVGFEMKDIIPAKSPFVIHTSFDDMSKWHKELKNYWRKHNPAQLTQIGEMENRYEFNINKFYDFISDEIGFFIIKSNRKTQNNQIFCIKHKDKRLATQFFTDLSHQSTPDSTWYHELYAERQIGHIEIDNIPSRIFGSLYEGFSSAYFFVDNDYVYIGNSQNALEILIDDIDEENTWRKSVRTNDFLESTNDDANFSIYFKTAGVFNLLENKLNKTWASFLADYKGIFTQIEYGAVQFTNVDDKFYTNISLEHPGDLMENTQSKKQEEFIVKSEMAFKNKLISKPFAVRNHNDQSLEVIVQDEANTLHLISSSNNVSLEIPLEGPLTSKIHQVDYYKNRKLQYLFSLDQTIHMIDRTGIYIPGYPVKVNSKNKIVRLSLIDSDQSRNYRILISDEKGNYYMYNKTGKPLKGWNPKSVNGRPHLPVKAKDFLLLQNGILHGLSRNENSKSGFPIDLKGSTSNDMYIEKDASPSSTRITALTDLGELITFNLEGTIYDRQQLIREDENVRFKMIKSNKGDEFLVIKIASTSLTIYDQGLGELFSINKPSDNIDFQFYRFAAENQLFILIDKESQLAYLYDLTGTMLHKSPLDAGFQMAVLNQESKSQYDLYCTFGNQLNIVSIKY